MLASHLKDVVVVAKEMGTGVIFESPTGFANDDGGAAIRFSPNTLKQLNQNTVTLMAKVPTASDDAPILISSKLGPLSGA
ncbi:hypothetical protein DS909_19095 [Phaeobacter gallaeciensis]|uniref:Uncharacterized protein n=1 Tax=Phaeobacter gallaeciensis TaxID=60890 RepID=A0A366WTF8_9RHOB|nr:hypothetical protein DS909_19095 [Phaeobacter gallaeciensis]